MSGQSTYSIGRLYGIHPTNVSFIVKRKTWRHVV